MVHTITITTPIGPLRLTATSVGLRAVSWPDDSGQHVTVDGESGETPDAATQSVLEQAATQLQAYFAGELTQFDLPLDPLGTDFQQRAWQVLRSIPFGTTISYREQADRLGNIRAVRAVGGANGKNPLGIVVPCHRVIGASGKLTGFAGGVDVKAWLLDHERAVLART